MVYQGLIYKIAKYEVRANMVVAAFKAGGDWRKDIELVKADARFKKDMEQVAKKVGPENAKEVAEAQNVILALNLRFGKDEVQADKKWFITVVLKGMAAGIAESLARKQEVEPPPRVVGEIGNPMLIAAPDSLAKYDPKKTFKVGVVPAATANQAKMANVVQGLANVKLNPVAKPLDTGNQPAVVPTHDSHKTTSSRKIDIHTNKPVAPGKVPEPPPRKSRGGGPNNSTS